jgi:hypothetical protein
MDQLNFASAGEASEDGLVQTHSGIKKWWLTHMKGYRVCRVARKPRRNWLGKIKYDCTYLLRPSQNS